MMNIKKEPVFRLFYKLKLCLLWIVLTVFDEYPGHRPTQEIGTAHNQEA